MSLNTPEEPQIQLMNTMWDVPGITMEHTDGIIGLFGDGTGTEDYFFYHLFTPADDIRNRDDQFIEICYQIAENSDSDWHCCEGKFDGTPFNGNTAAGGLDRIDFSNQIYTSTSLKTKVAAQQAIQDGTPLVSKGDGQFTGYMTYNPFQVVIGKSVLLDEDNTDSFTRLSTTRVLRGKYYNSLKDSEAEWINFSEILLGGVNTVSFAAVALAAGVAAVAF